VAEVDVEVKAQGRRETRYAGKAMEDMGKILRATLMDDHYMRRFFSDNIPCVEYVLRTIMDDQTLVVKSAGTQVLKSGPRHEVVLDIDAVDGKDEEYDIEVERSVERANPKRARFNSAMMDTNQLEKGRPYQDLRRSVVIFITEKDVLGENLPLYRIERTINGKRPFNDGTLILYVNNAIQDPNTELGRLMHDFSCADADDMYSKLLADKTREFKDTRGGRSIMSTVWQEAQDEAAQREREATARIMLEDGESTEKTARYSRLPIAEVRVIAQGLGLASAL